MERVAEQKLELGLELRPLELEVLEELELLPTLELVAEQKLELWLELRPVELEVLEPHLMELRG